MKFHPLNRTRLGSRSGSAVIVMIVLLGIIFMYVAVNLKTLGYLKRELNLVERRQLQRIQSSTNTVITQTNATAPQSARQAPVPRG